jgi:hypothetical protein
MQVSKKKTFQSQQILKTFSISRNNLAAAYHGGKLNGVDCCQLISLTKVIGPLLQDQLLAVTHTDRCSSEVIIDTCTVHHDICLTLDLISSKIWVKY